MIRKIKSKDRLNFIDFCIYNQLYFDYKKVIFLFRDILRSKYICYVFEENDEIKGFILIENFKEPIVRIYVSSEKVVHGLLKYLLWHHRLDLTLKLNQHSIVKYICKRYKFFPVDETNTEITFFRKNYEKVTTQNGKRNYR